MAFAYAGIERATNGSRYRINVGTHMYDSTKASRNGAGC